MSGSWKTQKRALERARALLREAGELPKRPRHDGDWSWSSSSAGTPADSKSGWEDTDSQHWANAGADSWSSSSRAESSTPAKPATVPPPPPPARFIDPKAKAEIKVKAETADDAAEKPTADDAAEKPDFEIYSYGRKNGSVELPCPMNVTVNVECFRSSSNDQESWSCSGMNGSIMLEVATHSQLPQVIQKCIKDIIAAQGDDADDKPLRIGVQCYAGRHRSVAFATMLTDSLMEFDPRIEADKNGKPVQVQFMHMNESIRAHCGCPTDCSQLKTGQKVKDIMRVNSWTPEELAEHWLANGKAAIDVFRRQWAMGMKREIGILF